MMLFSSLKLKKNKNTVYISLSHPSPLSVLFLIVYHFQVWGLLTGDEPRPSLFMAVPTIYSKLIQHHDKRNLTKQDKEKVKSKCQQLRWKIVSSLTFEKKRFLFTALFSNGNFVKYLKTSYSFCLG